MEAWRARRHGSGQKMIHEILGFADIKGSLQFAQFRRYIGDIFKGVFFYASSYHIVYACLDMAVYYLHRGAYVIEP